MTSLSNLQNQFIDSIYDKKNRQILSMVKSGKAPKPELLDIYRNNLYTVLINVLRLTYPKTYKLIGEKKFKEISQKFIGANRSNSGNLDDYGENFPQFLQKKSEIFFGDLSHVEWLKQKAYLSRNSKIFDEKKLKTLSPEKLLAIKFNIHPSCHLKTSRYNLLTTKKPNKPLKNPQYFLIYRHELEVRVEKITQLEFNFLQGIIDGLSLYKIYQKNPELNLQKYLQKYVAMQIIEDFALSSTTRRKN